ncbi:MAG: DUF4384 domain-containing protein [Gammaproteobacteria bacterium]
MTGLLAACAHPHKVDVQLPESLPEAKITEFSRAIQDLGLMSSVYGAPKMHIMAKQVFDNTGTSLPTQAEIPGEITEMVKSTLNGIGGAVTFIPYDPEFVANNINTGYSGFEAKLIPDVVVSGGITEFDRALVTRGKSTDVGLDAEIDKVELGFEYGTLDQDSLASITLDFNLVDFRTFAGIPRIQAVNNIKVYKALAEDSLGFSISGGALGADLGFKGTVKKVQGRHAAVRLLVQLSLLQVMGKYLKLPYWRLLPGGQPDPVVLDQITADYYAMDHRERTLKVQEYLILSGYPVRSTGVLDNNTKAALKAFNAKGPHGQITEATYVALYSSVPISRQAQSRRNLLGHVEPIAAASEPPKRPEPLRAQERIDPTIGSYSKTAEPVRTEERSNLASSSDDQLRLWTNAESYRIGDPMRLFFEVSTPMHVRVLSVSSAGEIATLFPNQYQPQDVVRPGRPYEMPPADAPFTLHVAGPAGEDTIMAIASPGPFPSDLSVLTAQGEFTNEVVTTVPTRARLSIKVR